MKCQNCGENEANVKYTQIINGVKKEMMLCEKCSYELGVRNKINFNMPINLSSFLTDFLDEYNDGFMNQFNLLPKELKCDKCNMTYSEFVQTGNLGCANCYNIFSSKLDPLLKNIHGINRHIGRRGKISADEEFENKEISSQEKELQKLKDKLKKAIQEENYEEAAKIRDNIRNIEEGDGKNE